VNNDNATLYTLEPTMQLRVVVSNGKDRLQQAYLRTDTGRLEWKDVETITVGEELNEQQS